MNPKQLALSFAEMLINFSAGWFGLILFGSFLKTDILSIIFNILFGILSFVLAVIIRSHESN